MLILVTLLLLLFFFGNALAGSPYFVSEPRVISKTVLGGTGTLALYLYISFKATGLDNNAVTAYLTTTGGKSDNAVCINSHNDVPTQPNAIFGPTKGQEVVLQPSNGEMTFNNIQLSLTVTAAQANCANNHSAFVTLATLQNINLHLVQNKHNSSFEVLHFNFGDQTIPNATLDSKV